MITANSLKHPWLRIRLDKAMRKASFLSHEHGIGFAHVGGIDIVHIRRLIGGGFRFFDGRDRDITSTVLTALRSLHS